MNCKCKNIIATSGIAEPFVLINKKWVDLIGLKFICPICQKKIEYSNKNIYSYPEIKDVKL